MARPGRKRRTLALRTPYGQISRKGQYPALCERGVYVMAALGSGCIKIGVSNGPARRADSIQTGNPFPVEIRAFWDLGDKDAFRLECECHKRLRGKHIHAIGEWYRIEPDVAEAFIIQVAAEIGIKLAKEAA